MDSRTYRLAILSIISILLLVTLIVYAANADRITMLLMGRKDRADTGGSEAVAEVVQHSGNGEQIGDDLKGFLRDEDFFDDREKNSSVVISTDDKPPAYPLVDETLRGFGTEDGSGADDTTGTGDTATGDTTSTDDPSAAENSSATENSSAQENSSATGEKSN